MNYIANIQGDSSKLPDNNLLSFARAHTHIILQEMMTKEKSKRKKKIPNRCGMILRLVEWGSWCLAHWPSTQHTINLKRFKWKWTNYLFQRQKERVRERFYSFGIWPNSHRFSCFWFRGVEQKKSEHNRVYQ